MEEDLLKQSKSQMLDLIKEEKGSEPSDRLRIVSATLLSALKYVVTIYSSCSGTS
jgi:hypothetical protein